MNTETQKQQNRVCAFNTGNVQNLKNMRLKPEQAIYYIAIALTITFVQKQKKASTYDGYPFLIVTVKLPNKKRKVEK